MKQMLLFALAATLYVVLLGGSFLFWQEKFQASLSPILREPEESKKEITLLFAGDIMLDRGVEWYIRKNGEDWKWPFLQIAEVLKRADLVFGNLESIISTKEENQGSIYSFRAKPETLEGLSFAGFDILSVANNHSLDYGSDALLDSIRRLREIGIMPAGAGQNRVEAHAPVLKTVRDTTVAFLAYSAVGSPLWQAGENSPGIAWMDSAIIESLKEDIALAKEKAGLVVVSFHFGDEYQTEPNALQQLLSRAAIDEGASLVVGHHPHVAQPVERYKHGWIAYSLGNFVFDQGFSPETMQGILLKVLVQENSITQVMPLMIQISSEFQPAISKESTK